MECFRDFKFIQFLCNDNEIHISNCLMHKKISALLSRVGMFKELLSAVFYQLLSFLEKLLLIVLIDGAMRFASGFQWMAFLCSRPVMTRR